jgi:hypothetical protein
VVDDHIGQAPMHAPRRIGDADRRTETNRSAVTILDGT